MIFTVWRPIIFHTINNAVMTTHRIAQLEAFKVCIQLTIFKSPRGYFKESNGVVIPSPFCVSKRETIIARYAPDYPIDVS